MKDHDSAAVRSWVIVAAASIAIAAGTYILTLGGSFAPGKPRGFRRN